MRKKRFLAAILLGVVLCFVSGAGYGKVAEWMFEYKAPYIDVVLLNCKINYIMSNPDSFQKVEFGYDPIGNWGDTAGLPENINTKGKIVVILIDRRGLFPKKSGALLLAHLEIALKTLYSFLDVVATDMENDIVATFHKKGGAFVGYFYQGEYHLWEK